MAVNKIAVNYSAQEQERLEEVLLYLYLSKMYSAAFMSNHIIKQHALEIVTLLGGDRFVLEILMDEWFTHIGNPTREERVNALLFHGDSLTQVQKALKMSFLKTKKSINEEYIREAIISDRTERETIHKLLNFFENAFYNRTLGGQ